MNRWLLLGTLVGLLGSTTGCLHHQTRGGCKSCGTAACSTGACSTGSCSTGNCNTCSRDGILGKLRGESCGCSSCTGRTGCVAGPLGWQQGGLDYSSHLQPGVLGHHAGQQMQNIPFTPGPPSAQVGYPYYTVRGPRDFLLDNPPTIGR